MANKRNSPKPGSRRGVGEFRQLLWDTAKGGNQKWWEKPPKKTRGQKPMKQRKAELLATIQAKGENGLATNSINFYQPVLNKLIKDGDVVLKRNIYRTGFHGANRTAMVATWFPEPVEEEVREPYAKRKAALEEAGLPYKGMNQGTPRQDNQKVKWTKEKDQKLLMEVIKGTADEGLVQKVNRTKTKMRKITK
jgi:hypothetical protein